jgi:hypothetical protein
MVSENTELKGGWRLGWPRSRSPGWPTAISDVGTKFEEDVYYMAALFCCNIAASLALIAALTLAELRQRP